MIAISEIKQALIDLTRGLGFESCRIAACSLPAHAKEFGDWLNEGAHGEMNYMARGAEKRRDPQKILPGAKSIIVLAMNYFWEFRFAGGCGIATLCDFTLAVPEAKLGYTEVKIGFLPAIVSVFLTR